MVKDPGFRSENEVRVIHQLQLVELPKLRLRQKTSLMARHLPLAFQPSVNPDSKMLPIVGVMVGPSRHMEVSKISVAALMEKEGYKVWVTSSRIPFQMT
jgi:hypothetical protein